MANPINSVANGGCITNHSGIKTTNKRKAINITRIACVNIIKTAVLGIDQTTDAAGENLHVARLVALRAWARGLELAEAQLTFTVLEGSDPGAAIIDHAVQVRADHILMGARGHSTTRRYLGSVSSQVVAEAPCSVTVIRGAAEGNS